MLSSSTKVILFWTDYFGSQYWGMGKETHTKADLRNLNCPVTDCIITHDRYYSESADFLMFHVAGLGKPDIPKTRSITQSYVMFSLESPAHVGQKYVKYPEIFNLTMTYRLDSDIVMRYGIVRDKLRDEIVAPYNNPKWRKVDGNVKFGRLMLTKLMYTCKQK